VAQAAFGSCSARGRAHSGRDAGRPLQSSVGFGTSAGVVVDIQAEMQCNGFHGAVVSSHSPEESEPAPGRVRGLSCGSARPGNLRINERQPQRFFNPGAERAMRALRDKV